VSEPCQPPELPEVLEGRLDRAAVEQILADVAACAERLQVVPKRGGPRTMTPEGEQLDLPTAGDLLFRGELRGLQLRYVHQGQEWWDTLLPLGNDTYRLVRIQH
jgi:hypothetical protein